MATITVQVDLGPETRELIAELVEKATMRLELGPKTRELIEELARKPAEARGEDRAESGPAASG